MSRTFAVMGLVCVLGAAASTYAQDPPEVIVRQGDKIEWIGAAGAPHKVKFDTASTPSITDILDFTPPLVNGESAATSGTLQTATVKVNPATVGKTFVFRCAIHPAQMISLPFVVAEKGTAAARTHRIMGESTLNWHVHGDTTP